MHPSIDLGRHACQISRMLHLLQQLLGPIGAEQRCLAQSSLLEGRLVFGVSERQGSLFSFCNWKQDFCLLDSLNPPYETFSAECSLV